MRVYIVKRQDPQAWFEHTWIMGVYTSREMAETFIEDYINNWEEDKQEEERECLSITPWNVNQPIS